VAEEPGDRTNEKVQNEQGEISSRGGR
jgi:hypothetical protein